MCVDYFDIEELKRWFNDDGDNKYRFNYNLDENSRSEEHTSELQSH